MKLYKSTHTLGPWTVTENTYPTYIMAGPFMVAQVADADVGPQCAANADLIAAAPDLLAACKALIGYAESDLRNLESDAANGVEDAQEFYDSCRESIAAGYAAIAKAEGGAA